MLILNSTRVTQILTGMKVRHHLGPTIALIRPMRIPAISALKNVNIGRSYWKAILKCLILTFFSCNVFTDMNIHMCIFITNMVG